MNYEEIRRIMKFVAIGTMVAGVIGIILFPQNLESEFLGPIPVGGFLLFVGFFIWVISRWTK